MGEPDLDQHHVGEPDLDQPDVATLARQFGLATMLWWLTGIAAPLLAGGLTAYYTGVRGGIHAFSGGLLSIPIFGLFVFPNAWQLAIFAGAFCTLGGAIMELVLRRRG